MKEKVDFTLEDLLAEVLFKEHLQALLEEYGESSSGQKPELVERFLNSERVHKMSVETVVREILKELPASDLHCSWDFGPTDSSEVTRAVKRADMVSCVS